MTDFASIDTFVGSNIGGSSRIYYVPVPYVDDTSFPSRTPGSMSLLGNINLTGSHSWYYIKCVLESIGSEIDGVSGQSGSSYNHQVSGFIKSDDKALAALFERMTYFRFLVLRKDTNGHVCLLGTINEPLSFSFKKRTGARASELKGFDFVFSASCTKPELYYTGTITPVTDNGYVYPGDNIGGSIMVYYVPVNYVNATLFPKRQPGTTDLVGDIILNEPYNWLHIACHRETIDAEIPVKNSFDGSLYEHNVSGFVRSDNAGISWLFQKMSYSRFLVLRKDANGHMCLSGTLKEPLSFSFKKRVGSRVNELKGYDFSFSARCTKPELYYSGELSQSDDNGYVENGYVERGYVS